MNQKTRAAVIACGALIFCAWIFAHPTEQDKKTIPDHTQFKSCEPCHADKVRMWETSGHSRAIGRVEKNKAVTSDCYGCHSTEGFRAKTEGDTPKTRETFHSISCLACHKPGGKEHAKMLVMDSELICSACHTQGRILEGTGARGIEETRSFHSAVPCVSCHMTGGNHLMKVIRPDDPTLTEKSADSCTACHKDNNRKARAHQIQDWQSEYQEKMDALQADLDAITAASKAKPDLLTPGQKQKLGDVQFNLSLLTRDGSRGAHNLDFTLEILAVAAKDLKELKAALQ